MFPPHKTPNFLETSPPTLHQGIGHNAVEWVERQALPITPMTAARKRSHWPRQDITNAHASKLFLQECPNFPRGALLCYWTAYSRPVSSSRCERCTRDPHTLWSPHPVCRVVCCACASGLQVHRAACRALRGDLRCYRTAYSHFGSSSRCERCTRDPHPLWSPHFMRAGPAGILHEPPNLWTPVISDHDESLLYAISSKRELRLQRREEC